MPSTDDILAAIDSAVDDWEVSDDAVRMLPPGAPKPDSPSGYTAGAGRWVYAWERTGEVPVLQTYRDGWLWGAVLPQEEYTVSDGEHTAVMPPPPREGGVWFAAMTEPGVTPEWQRYDGCVSETTWGTARPGADMTFWVDRPSRPCELSVTLHADCGGFTEVLGQLAALMSTVWARSARRHAIKSEYRRRTRRRNR